jgi:hypothetical protein
MASFAASEEAQEKLAELLDRAQGGEEIAIERDGKARGWCRFRWRRNLRRRRRGGSAAKICSV